MGEIRLYNFCEHRTTEVIKKVLRTLRQTGATVVKQYEIPETKVSMGKYYSEKTRKYKQIKCCADHSRLPEKSEITTVIEYISTVTL